MPKQRPETTKVLKPNKLLTPNPTTPKPSTPNKNKPETCQGASGRQLPRQCTQTFGLTVVGFQGLGLGFRVKGFRVSQAAIPLLLRTRIKPLHLNEAYYNLIKASTWATLQGDSAGQ